MTEATRNRANTRARLLTAAAEVFAERGIGESSVELICDRAGYTRGAFYSNFASKEELFLALCIDVTDARLEGVRDRVRRLIERRDSNTRGRLYDAAELIEILGPQQEDRLTIMLMHEIMVHAMRDPKLAAAYLAREHDVVDAVIPIVEVVIETRRRRLPISAEEVARMLLTTWQASNVAGVLQGRNDRDVHEHRNAAITGLLSVLFAAGEYAEDARVTQSTSA